MPKRLTLVSSTLLCILFATKSFGADLIVNIVGLRNNNGDVHIALYDNPVAFPSSDNMLREVQKAIDNRQVKHRFVDLTPGYYALATYHDENGNNSFDTNFFSLPIEGYAFSNDAKVFLGPPSFLEAQINVTPYSSKIQIRMGY